MHQKVGAHIRCRKEGNMKFNPTPTSVCETMNRAYEMLRTMNIEQLHEAHDETLTRTMPEEMRIMMLYQIGETIRRKKAGLWKEYEND